MRSNKLIFLLSAVLVCYFHAFPQFTCKNFLSVGGKKDASIKCIVQDKNNFLWLGTREGLLRFDGKRTESFKKELAGCDQNITALLSDDKGSVWIGTEKGKVYSLNEKKEIDSLDFGKDLPSAKITSLFLSSAGSLYIGTYGNGIYIRQKKSILHLNTTNGLSDDVVYNLFFNEGRLWCGTDAGISVLSDLENKPQCVILSNKDGLPDNIVRNISGHDKDLIISMQDSGVCLYNSTNRKFERITPAGNWTYGAVINAFMYNGSDIAIASEKNGLITISKNKTRIINYPENIKTSAVNAFFKDASGNFWLASAKGLHLFYRPRYYFLNAISGLNSDKITAIAVDDQRSLWIGTEKGVQKITRNNNDDVVITNEDRISGVTISCIAKDAKGCLWFGTYSNGIIILDPVTGKIHDLNSKFGGLPNDNISTINFEKGNRVLISTLGGGLIEAEHNAGNLKVLKVYAEEDGLGSNYVYASITDEKGHLFAANDGGGLQVYENSSFISLTKKFKLNSSSVFSLCKDSKGNIWAVSNNSGVLKYNGTTIESIGIKNGLREEQPEQLISFGNSVYAIHSLGIDKINCDDNSVSYYDIFEGDLEPNLNAICADSNYFYSGTNNGVLSYRYSNTVSDSMKPVALITGLQINYRTFPLDSSNKFDPGQNNISFSFDGVWLKNPEKLSFRYKLEGFEEKWNFSNEGKVINYNNLDAGSYKFIVQAKNEEGSWSGERIYEFTVLAPLWKKWWFWVLVVLIGSSLIYLFLQYRLKNLQKKNILLEEKVRERTSEIEKQSEIIEEKNKELELLSLVASKTDNVVLILDPDGRIEYVNESFVRLNHISLEELQKKGETIYESSNNPNIRATVDEAVKNKRSVKYESLNKIEGQADVWEASTLTPIFNEKGELKQIIIIDSDITESKKQEHIIFEKNKDITASIEYARKIQTAILPAEEIIKKCLPESFILYKTKDIVSGDFYWFSDKEDCSVIAAVDCTGHGVPGAFMSIIGYNILNKIVNEQDVTDPGTILQKLNEGVMEALHKNQANPESNDGMDIAICKIKHNSNEMEFAGAMRPLWIIDETEVKEIKGDKIPIGMQLNENRIKVYTTHTVQLKKNETAYIFTDGYSDQFGGPKGKKYSMARFKELLLKNHRLEVGKQNEILLEEHLSWKGSQGQLDDILVIGFKI
jgi:ligand-binding sensor domain-containing protein/serine phosphatase RsbU (regulator of sigma subunit)/PAS domain-containing protein